MEIQTPNKHVIWVLLRLIETKMYYLDIERKAHTQREKEERERERNKLIAKKKERKGYYKKNTQIPKDTMLQRERRKIKQRKKQV